MMMKRPTSLYCKRGSQQRQQQQQVNMQLQVLHQLSSNSRTRFQRQMADLQAKQQQSSMLLWTALPTLSNGQPLLLQLQQQGQTMQMATQRLIRYLSSCRLMLCLTSSTCWSRNSAASGTHQQGQLQPAAAVPHTMLPAAAGHV
jgi:hypothetical protein